MYQTNEMHIYFLSKSKYEIHLKKITNFIFVIQPLFLIILIINI